jgi:hypothetical protein
VVAANGGGYNDGDPIKNGAGETIGWSNSWNFVDKKNSPINPTVTVTSNGQDIQKGEAQGNNSGGTITMSGTNITNVTGTLLENVSSGGGGTILEGSKVEEKTDMVGTITGTGTLANGGTISISGHNNASWLYVLTVTNGGNGVKIIFNATATLSMSKGIPITASQLATLTALDEDMAMDAIEGLAFGMIDPSDVHVEGTLKVYGQGDKEVYSIEIKTLNRLNTYLNYFNTSYDF